MLSFNALLLVALATWRITNIIHSEKIAEPIRNRIGISDLDALDSISLKYLFSCFMCLSVWVGIVCTLIYFIYPYILLPFAFSAVAIYINQLLWKE